MDLLYSRYASPYDFMHQYVKRGRFGEFVLSTINAENKRRKEQAEKENDDKLWSAYIHSGSDASFIDWKENIVKSNSTSTGKRDADMTNKDVDDLIKRLFPKK